MLFLLNIHFDAGHLHRTVWLDSRVVNDFICFRIHGLFKALTIGTINKHLI